MTLSYAAALRRELNQRSRLFAKKLSLPHSESYGAEPTLCYEPFADRHGNFLDASFRALEKNPEWSRRLKKAHSQARKSFPANERGFRSELDATCSSDALLMNVFCHPRALKPAAALLGVEDDAVPEFGYKARVPMEGNRFDRTEVDMRLGDLLIEAKLTEGGFQSKDKTFVVRYRDLRKVFAIRELPQTKQQFLTYQLIRNVLAAEASSSRFCVLCDARRPELIELWYATMRTVKPHDLRMRMRVLTWQELSAVLPPELRRFLQEKYGIVGS